MALLMFPSMASAAGTSTVQPITTFTVTTGPSCAGGAQSPIVEPVQSLVYGLSYPGPGGLTLPTVSLNPGCDSPPTELSLLISASNTISTSPSGSATVSSEALGDDLLAEQASAIVNLSAPIPLTSPASSVEVAIPYTTSGVRWSTPAGSDDAGAAVSVVPEASNIDSINCADGSFGIMSGDFDTSFTSPTPPGSGTLDLKFSCPDGSDLVSGVGFRVQLTTSVYSASGHTESAAANFAMSGVTATIAS